MLLETGVYADSEDSSSPEGMTVREILWNLNLKLMEVAECSNVHIKTSTQLLPFYLICTGHFINGQKE